MIASCHCGAVVLDVTLTRGLETAGRCDCSFCKRRAAPAVTAPKDGVHILQGADALTLYQWGTQTARHHFCKICGIYMFHNRRADPNEIGVNMGTLEGVNPAEHEPIPWTDGINHPSDRAD
ncbi:GFA family protein [uncultured Tateyamaria sp.]|uniref:GFA family protein n=1 Tax=uncultured Tateyamaria sp. TaxID=455651 RepID=UPI0026159A69|nr:GFA family protein [uncultured Tateyamaria sp.]